MLVGIHQLHYLPWLRYIEKIVHCDVFVVLDSIQYNKNGWQNRNKIKTTQGATLLTVPVVARGSQNLDEVLIAGNGSWQRKHWRSIEQAYGKARYFEDYASGLERIYTSDWTHLNAINRAMLEFYVDSLGITTRIEYSSVLDVPGDATERLVNLIKAVGGDTYYSGAFALEAYLDAAYLKEAGIGLELQEWSATVYPQLHGEFVPDLALLDLMMNCGPDSVDILCGKHS
jgi:hypothetical protein